MIKTITTIALVSTLASRLAVAGEWEHSFSLAASGEHDSNPTMSEKTEGSVWRGRLAPQYSLVANLGPDDYAATLGLVANQSSDERLSSSRQDKNGLLSWGHAFETGNVQFSARADEASTRATEFEDSGLVRRESTRNSYTFSMHAKKSLSERTYMTAGASKDRAKYEDPALSNYANQRAEIGLEYALNEGLETATRLAVTEYDPDGPGVPSQSYSITFGVAAQSGTQLSWTAQYGVRHTTADTTSNGSDGRLSLQWKGATDYLSFEANRQYSPSSTGSMSVVDTVKAAWQSHWGPKSRSSLDLSMTKRHRPFDTDTAQVTAAFIYDASYAFGVRVYLQKKHLDFASSVATATVFGASLAYNWRP